MIADNSANDVSLPISKTSLVSIESSDGGVTNSDPIMAANSPARVNQQRLAPSSVKGRSIEFLQVSNRILVESAVVPRGQSAIFSTVINNAQGETTEAFPSYQIYIGDDAPANQPNNRMPEVISSALYPFYSWEALYLPDGTPVSLKPGSSVHNLQVRNNDALGDRVITVEIFVKFMVNNSSIADVTLGNVSISSFVGGFGGG